MKILLLQGAGYFIVKELVPFIDSEFHTIKSRDSRAIIGDMTGGRGAQKLAMINADVFSVVYALNPVAAGTSDIPWPYVSLDWKAIHQAKSFADITDGRTQLFITFNQAFLPNLNRPRFYCDFFMERENGEAKLNVANAMKMERGLLLDETLNESEIEHEAEEYAGNPYDKNWIANGRFFSCVLPFLNRHLVFDEISQP